MLLKQCGNFRYGGSAQQDTSLGAEQESVGKYADSFLLSHPCPAGDFHWQSLVINLIWVKYSSWSRRRQRKVHNEFGGTNQI